jgi:hypothetical protein
MAYAEIRVSYDDMRSHLPFMDSFKLPFSEEEAVSGRMLTAAMGTRF